MGALAFRNARLAFCQITLARQHIIAITAAAVRVGRAGRLVTKETPTPRNFRSNPPNALRQGSH